jgi:hypothetical protein
MQAIEVTRASELAIKFLGEAIVNQKTPGTDIPRQPQYEMFADEERNNQSESQVQIAAAYSSGPSGRLVRDADPSSSAP